MWADYRLERERHTLRATLGMEVYSATLTDDAFRGVGMSSDHMDYISFAQRYAAERPEGTKTYERVLSGYGVVSWSLDRTLFVDLAGRVDKSSMLAPDKRTAGLLPVSGKRAAGSILTSMIIPKVMTQAITGRLKRCARDSLASCFNCEEVRFIRFTPFCKR